MSELGALVQDALGRAVLATLPLMLVALVGSALAGWAMARVGLRDTMAATVLRGLLVLLGLVLLAEGLAAGARGLASEAWSQLAAVGRAAR
ncbi:hypothetical protein [Paraliomyxa miuraensis]|uniref:hypothetical protein n=1 Tax=Paraliomyxa miuraensis TaxID=376150 RepID=UPI002251A8BF|nr:hypothetical protein [Paraliomyxa miuraensis]MCX4241306.1 hypothetical protein [Paraliomyxa miuraensis]